MIVLGIDTSCYTTSVAAADETGIRTSQRQLLPVEQGARGLRQSEAVFAHMKQLPVLLEQVMEQVRGETIAAVCVSRAPRDAADSYMPVFMAGQSFARGIAAALNVPLYYTTHQRGHVRAALEHSGITQPKYLALHLSGGTTEVLLMDGEQLTPLLQSKDLHAGQLIDRTGVALGLPFPAGPALEKLALTGQSQSRLSVSVAADGCHFSGAEAQVMRWIKDQTLPAQDIAREVFSLIVRTTARLLLTAKAKTGVSTALLTGGVASSALFRAEIAAYNDKRRLGLKLYFGLPQYAGDNAAGVALLGRDYRMGEKA